ncbi:FecR family protein [Roseivirga sp.]|uniref:FecR family protein n=1 Tax=Roseivirga sp. TaxID=1964215 RepID=UPI003B8C7AE5
MKNDSIISDHQLLNYLKDAATPEEKAQIDAWLFEGEENRLELENIRKVWERSQSLEDFESIDLDRNWSQLQAKIGNPANEKSSKQYIWRYAAAVVLLAAATFLLLKPGTVEMQEMVASNGKAEVHLADGTTVWLNEGAKLDYPDAFKGDYREVTLEGEAFFDVAHNPDKPFVVNAGGTKTEVLGTTFNINKGEGESFELNLITGKVRFTKGRQQALLDPGQKITVDAKGSVKKTVNREVNFMSWRTNKLVFENTPMEEVVSDISAHYGVVLEIMHKGFLGCPVTTTFENETIDEVLETLADLFDITIKREGQLYQLVGKGCK